MTASARFSAQYVAREMAASAATNAVLSSAFFVLFFGLVDPAPVKGVGGYGFDFLPQSLAVAFFASFVPSMMSGKALIAGKLPSVGSLLLYSVLYGAIAATVGGGTIALLLNTLGSPELANLPALAIKAVYGGALGAMVTRFALRRLAGLGAAQ